MQFKRALAAGITVVVAAVSLAGCASSDSGPSGGSADGKGTLTFLSWDNETIMKPLITEFEKENPGIKIDFSYAPPTQQYNDTLQKRLVAGQGADVFVMGNKSTELVKAGYVKDLAGMPVLKNLSKFNINAYSTDGKPYGVSVASWGGGLAVNLDLLKKAGITGQPGTWNDFLADLSKLKKAGITPYLEGSDSVPAVVMAKIGQADAAGGGMDAKIEKGTTTFSAAWTKPLQQWSQMYTRGLVSKDTAGLTGDQVQAEFLAGRVAMIASGSWAMSAMRQGAPKMDFAWWPVPGPKAGQSFWAGAAAPAYAINARAKNPVAAEKWIDFLASPTGLRIFQKTTGSITTTSNFKADLDPSLKGMYADVLAGKVWCPWQAWPGAHVNQLDTLLLSNVQKIMLGQVTAAQATEALTSTYATLSK